MSDNQRQAEIDALGKIQLQNEEYLKLLDKQRLQELDIIAMEKEKENYDHLSFNNFSKSITGLVNDIIDKLSGRNNDTWGDIFDSNRLFYTGIIIIIISLIVSVFT